MENEKNIRSVMDLVRIYGSRMNNSEILMMFYEKQKMSKMNDMWHSKRIFDGVHVTHCCLEHGCKYAEKDCPVESGIVKQKYPCESCKYHHE